MKPLSTLLFLCAITVAGLVSNRAYASPADPMCHNSELFSGKLITDICWKCLFPIRIAGVNLGRGGSAVPKKATDRILCFCSDNAGLPIPGLTIGMWAPARILEFTRAPGCSMALGGIRLPLADRRFVGTAGRGEYDKSDPAFYHSHQYAFPLTVILDLFVEENCISDGYFDFDLIMMSELDPTWNSSELAFWTHPEAAAVANPAALAACVADSTAATADEPIDELFWCAGTWGHLYPFSGKDDARGSMAENTSMLQARTLAAGHRRGLMWRTMGDDAVCKGRLDPMFPKSMYKTTMFFPSAMTSRGAMIGESDYRWGQNRSIPGMGEDALYVLWRWTDCCTSRAFGN